MAKSFQTRSKGFVVIALALTLVLFVGMLALVFDLARTYIAKNELQAYSDAAALAATRHLDGTDNGITHARDTATNYPDKWNFQTAAPESVAVSFASNAAGPYDSNPASATGIKYVRVVATGTVTLYFMPAFSQTAPLAMMLLTIGRQQSLTAKAATGEFLKSSTFYTGLLPYSPYAHDAKDSNFGFTVGQQYTLRWPPPGQSNKNNFCSGDVGFSDPSSSASQRGFIDIGYQAGSGGSAYIREAIISSVQSHPLNVGDQLNMVMGNRGTESDALRERFNEDTDTTSVSWSDYYNNLQDGLANGRRLGIVPINNPNNNDTVLGFALMLLQSDVCGNSNVSPCCATYVGNTVALPGLKAGASSPGVYVLKLLQ